ncbi:hypothetical protein [Bacteroides graminisolvens]|uniref:hypothetical protein n=1 Tax=Bacteroides graminisolvens TaxID=477666 RepID=UPI000489343E|nr:hypothetical protein [Bacteroides graminisolvens]
MNRLIKAKPKKKTIAKLNNTRNTEIGKASSETNKDVAEDTRRKEALRQIEKNRKTSSPKITSINTRACDRKEEKHKDKKQEAPTKATA